jgi:neurotransmitter:Na+ symporter, NSS family
MSELPRRRRQENWGSRIGVILAVAGSAVGLGNFLRFPSEAVNNGGGAFMIPYLISFLIVGIPIAWCEWTLGRLGGRYGQHSGPGIFYAISRGLLGRVVGVITLLVPIGVYMYYVLIEALCLKYCIDFATGAFSELFRRAEERGGSVVDESAGYFAETFGLTGNGGMFGTSMLWLVLLCFVVNFFIIYRGIAKGIERFCIAAMPLLIACAVIVLIRVLTLDNVVEGRTLESGLGFMWNPDWQALGRAEVWLAAAGQIFFSLSVGFGLIVTYSSYVRKNDDVVLTSVTASSTNEFCEVILGGLIVVPAAFLFFGAEQAQGGTFSLGFITLPGIMHNMPGGALAESFFGATWFGLLFLAAVTSSISMLQPAIAFLEDGFGLRRTGSVTLIALITLVGAGLIMYYSEALTALDHTDFWVSFLMILGGLGVTLIFGWGVGVERGLDEANRGAAIQIPRWLAPLIKYVTPAFLIVILVGWFWQKGPEYVEQMSPSAAVEKAAAAVYGAAIAEEFGLEIEDPDERRQAILAKLEQIEAADETADAQLYAFQQRLPEFAAELDAQTGAAENQAMVARAVFVGFILMFLLIFALADVAIGLRIRRAVRRANVTVGEGMGP